MKNVFIKITVLQWKCTSVSKIQYNNHLNGSFSLSKTYLLILSVLSNITLTFYLRLMYNVNKHIYLQYSQPITHTIPVD